MAEQESHSNGGNDNPPPLADDDAAPRDVDMALDDDSATMAAKDGDGDNAATNTKDDDAKVDDDDDDPAGDDDDAAGDASPDDLLVRAASHKEDGNAHFKAGALDLSARAYRKGTNLLKKLNEANTGDDQVKALLVTLQTNLSMVCHRQGKHRMARDVASRALAIESLNVKALYRRAAARRALGDLDAARADLRAALKVEPENRGVRKELVSLQKALNEQRKGERARLSRAFSGKVSALYEDKEEEERRKAKKKEENKKKEAEEKERRKKEWEDECVDRMASDPPKEVVSFDEWDKARKHKEEEEEKARKEEEEKARKKSEEERRRNKAACAATADDKSNESDDDQLTEKELAMLRGYKKTSDGRTTSYFNREQTKHEQELIGSIAPKRLEEPAAPSPTFATGAIGSAWNQSGTTWEEKDTTDWCKTTLERCLLDTTAAYCSVTAPDATYVAVVKKVCDLTGDASVALAGGKKRYIYDFHLGVKYEVQDDSGARVAAGKLRLPDVNSATTADAAEFDVEVLAWKHAPVEAAAQDTLECQRMLIQEVHKSILKFVEKFNANF